MEPIAKLLDLSGKTAIITGGALGIGYGIACRLGEAGAQVVIADANESAANDAVAKLREAGYSALSTVTDVASAAAVREAVDRAVTSFGSVDILINNAGIYPMVPVMNMTEEDLDRVLSVNLKGAFLMTKIVAERMMAQGKGGSIVNITSIDALHPSMVGLAAYDASKHGLWGFTKNAALELAPHGIRINAIAPGGIETPGAGAGHISDDARRAFEARIPLARMGQPDDIGTVALFLASDMARYMTGAQVVVDGGRLLA